MKAQEKVEIESRRQISRSQLKRDWSCQYRQESCLQVYKEQWADHEQISTCMYDRDTRLRENQGLESFHPLENEVDNLRQYIRRTIKESTGAKRTEILTLKKLF